MRNGKLKRRPALKELHKFEPHQMTPQRVRHGTDGTVFQEARKGSDALVAAAAVATQLARHSCGA